METWTYRFGSIYRESFWGDMTHRVDNWIVRTLTSRIVTIPALAGFLVSMHMASQPNSQQVATNAVQEIVQTQQVSQKEAIQQVVSNIVEKVQVEQPELFTELQETEAAYNVNRDNNQSIPVPAEEESPSPSEKTVPPPEIVENIPEEQEQSNVQIDTRNLDGLQPHFRSKVEAVLRDLAAKGWKPRVVEGLRTIEQQQEKYRKGLSKIRGAKGKHTQGLAADVIDSRWGWSGPLSNKDHAFWKDLAEIAVSHGLKSGRYWRMKDVAHVEMPSKIKNMEASWTLTFGHRKEANSWSHRF